MNNEEIGSHELNFRAWHLKQKLWIPEDEIFLDSKGSLWHYSLGGLIKVTPGTYKVVQSTGQKDGKGIDVYGGHIIECEYHRHYKEKEEQLIFQLVVRWSGDGSFHAIRNDDRNTCYSVGFGGSAVKRWEVIGHILENPELYKK